MSYPHDLFDSHNMNDLRFDKYKKKCLMIIKNVSSHNSFKIETIILKM